MKRLFSIFCVVILIGVVIASLLLLAPYIQSIPETYHLIVATWTMAIFTVILAAFAIIQGIAAWEHLKAFREDQTWDRLRAHSKKLEPILHQWNQEAAMASPGKLEVKYGNPVFSTLSSPFHEYFASIAVWEHMKTGYKKNLETWEKLERKFNHHKEESMKFFHMLENEMKRRVRLPTYSFKGKAPEEWFNSLRCAEIAYSVLTGKNEAKYYFKDQPPKIERHKSRRYEMGWPPGTTIAMTNKKTECTVIEQAVTDLIEDSRMVREGNKLSETAQDITEGLDNFRGQLQTLIGIIELGGILEGDCKYCQRLKLK